MVLERMLNPFSLKKRPWEMFVAGFAYSFVGVGLAHLVFSEVSDLLMVFLIVLATLPTLYVTIRNEQELELKYEKESSLLKEHTKVIVFLIFLFLGITNRFSGENLVRSAKSSKVASRRPGVFAFTFLMPILTKLAS